MTNFILYENHERAIICLPADVRVLYSLDTAARLTGVHPEMLRYYCSLGLLGAERSKAEREPAFDDNALYEIRRIEHCRREHGISLRALPLICGLWREVEQLQTELRFYRGP